MNLPSIERRTSLRAVLNVPVRVRLVNSVLPERYAELLNISKAGAYLATWHRFRVGDVLDFATDVTAKSRIELTQQRYLGHVVRVQVLDPRVHSLGVAVRFESQPLSRLAHRPRVLASSEDRI